MSTYIYKTILLLLFANLVYVMYLQWNNNMTFVISFLVLWFVASMLKREE